MKVSMNIKDDLFEKFKTLKSEAEKYGISINLTSVVNSFLPDYLELMQTILNDVKQKRDKTYNIDYSIVSEIKEV